MSDYIIKFLQFLNLWKNWFGQLRSIHNRTPSPGRTPPLIGSSRSSRRRSWARHPSPGTGRVPIIGWCREGFKKFSSLQCRFELVKRLPCETSYIFLKTDKSVLVMILIISLMTCDILKGTVSWNFFYLGFFHQTTTPVPKETRRKHFECCRLLVPGKVARWKTEMEILWRLNLLAWCHISDTVANLKRLYHEISSIWFLYQWNPSDPLIHT
jgi:hypothetical protein